MEVVRWLLGAILVAGAASKIVWASDTRRALGTYGIASARVRAVLWVLLVAIEAALGAAVGMGVAGAVWAAAAVFTLFAAALTLVLRRGHRGAPCGCFGRGSRVGIAAIVRAAALAVGCVALAVVPRLALGTQTWLEIGLVVALTGLALLGAAVLVLARELGEIKLSLPPQYALSLADEGPALGSGVALAERFQRGAPLSLAVFTSRDCRLCAAVAPAIGVIATDPSVEVVVLDEERDATEWRELGIPGSPYAIVLGRAGTVLAKGTFNTLAQLDGLLAHARSAAVEALAA